MAVSVVACLKNEVFTSESGQLEINIHSFAITEAGMLRSFFGAFGGDGQEGDRESGEEGLQPDQQSEERLQQQQAQNDRFAQETGGQALKAIWDTSKQQATNAAPGDTSSRGSSTETQAAGAQTGRQGESSSQSDRKTGLDEETPEERHERQRLEGRINVAKAKRAEQKLETIADAVEYCRELVDVQLERARDQKAPMNQAIYGDSHARKAITTLLPDQFIRQLFLNLVQNRNNWPRIRPLFGVPPYNFLRPEDAGLIRAGGLAAGRTNMTYEKVNETAAYAQFGSGHLVDDYFREYRVVTTREPSDNDLLPCDIERVPPQGALYMNVRVPKRSKEEKLALLKDISKRRAVLFPAVGEVLTVNYSTGLQSVWGSKANSRLDTKVVVKSMIPRSSTGATAAVVAVKVS